MLKTTVVVRMLHRLRRYSALRPSNGILHPLSTVLRSEGQISVLDRHGNRHGGNITHLQRIDHRISVSADHSSLSPVGASDRKVYEYRICNVCARRVGEFLKSRAWVGANVIPECVAQYLRVGSAYTSGLLVTNADTSQTLHLLYAHHRRRGGFAEHHAFARPAHHHVRQKHIESDRRDHDPKLPRNEPGRDCAQFPLDADLLAPCLGVSR